MLLLAVLLTVVLVSPSQADEPSGDPVASASAALEDARPAEAERLLRELLTREPFRVDAHRVLAEALAAQGRRAEAVAQLTELGQGLLRATRYDLAAEALTDAAALAPDNGQVAALLGRALLLAQDFLPATAALERAVARGERSPTTRLYLAAALWESGSPEKAEPIYHALVAETRGAFVVVHQLARLLVWQGRAEEALPFLERAASKRPAAADVQLDLATALEGAGQLDTALDVYRRAVELAPESTRARYGLSRLLARRGQREAARGEMETYRRLYAAEQERTRVEGLERARLDRGWELLDASRVEEAMVHFASLSESPESLAGHAQARSAAGQHAKAVELLERAVELAPERADLRQLLATQRMASESR